MKYIVIILALIMGLFVLNKIGLWLEAKGWIYWRKKGAGGGALQELDTFFRPSARYTIELKQKALEQRNDSGAKGPRPNSTAPKPEHEP